MTKEYEMRFVVDGRDIGGGTITVMEGRVLTEGLEENFYAALRKNEKGFIEEAEEEEKSHIIDNLLPLQEDKLKEAHGEDYIGTDDDMPDAYESWLMDLSLEDLKKILV